MCLIKIKTKIEDVYYNFKKRIHVKKLKSVIDPYYFFADEKLSALETSIMAIRAIRAPKEFKNMLEDEFGSSAYALPTTYVDMRLNHYKAEIAKNHTAMVRKNKI